MREDETIEWKVQQLTNEVSDVSASIRELKKELDSFSSVIQEHGRIIAKAIESLQEEIHNGISVDRM